MVSRGLKICLAVSTLFFIIVATVIVTLFLTIFKLKDPEISVHPVDLKKVQLFLFSPNGTVNMTIGMVISIVNPNYGSFEYINSTGHVYYYDTIVAEFPIVNNLVLARSNTNVSTSAGFMTRNLMSDPNFWSDVGVGTLNLTSKATLPGKVSVLNIFKLKAAVYGSCNIAFNISSQDVDSRCTTKIKL